MRAWIGYVLIGLAAVGLLIGVRHDTVSDREAARKHYIESAHADALGAAGDVEDKLRAIYENLRTLTFLPSVREIDRHGTNLSEEARATIQQIYNNLASNVAVSEVYIVPASLDPERIDPVTGKPEEPILMFDELIVNAGSRVPVSELRQSRPAEFASAPEVEIFEYRQLKQQLEWLKQNYPTFAKIESLQECLHEGAWQPIDMWPESSQKLLHERKRVDSRGRVYAMMGPQKIVPVVCGGLGNLHATLLTSWGESEMQSMAVRRPK